MRCAGRLQTLGLAWLLILMGLESPATAQPDVERDIKVCGEAKTHVQCQAVLPACERALAVLTGAPADPKRDAIQRTVLNNSAGCEYQLGHYANAEAHVRNVLVQDRRVHGPEHPHVADSLNDLAVVLSRQGKLKDAESVNRQALGLREKLLGAEHPDIADSLNNLATVLSRQGRYEAAENLLRRALQMNQALLGTEHPDVALSLNNLASVLSEQGKYEAAEPLYRQALGMRQKLLGAEHPDVASSLNNLAGVLDSQGKYAAAEHLYRQALVMTRTLLGAEHVDVAGSLNNLAYVLSNQGKHEAAEPLYQQSLAMMEKLLGAEHPDVATSRCNLASVLSSQGKYKAAEPLYRQALRTRQKLLGAEHPHVAVSLNNLASVLSHQGEYELAEPLYRQALAMLQRLLGTEHPDVATSLNNVAALLIRRGQLLAALPLYAEAASIEETLVRAIPSETRMKARLVLFRPIEDALYGLLLAQPAEESLKRLVLTTALLRKGRAAEAGTLANRLLHQSRGNPALEEQFTRWQQVRRQREALLFGGRGNLSLVAYHERLKELGLQADDLESQLAAVIPELRQLQPPKFDDILPAVAARLPKDGALIEILLVRPVNFKASGTEERWKPSHYVALALTADQQIVVKDLGEGSTVDSQVQALLLALRSLGSDPTQRAKVLFDQILKPVLPESAKQLFLSLDGSLHLIPFDALHDGTDYLLGRYKFHYLTSGRDLLTKPSSKPVGPALVIGNPYFGSGAKAIDETGSLVYQRLTNLSDLPWAQQEAESVAKLLGVRAVTGASAKEDLLRERLAPSVVHLATHGLFLTDVEPPMSPGTRSALLLASPTEDKKPASTEPPVSLPGVFGPMNRAALVFANARQGAAAEDKSKDGLLTAEEARSLDLDGTQLVVLSACETGQGETSSGQGVYGLRRAFLIAGAETVVTSLWRVHDEATGELMTKYYGKLLDKEHPGDRLGAMIESMQELRARTGREHPYYWAPFLVIGADGPLRGPANVSQ